MEVRSSVDAATVSSFQNLLRNENHVICAFKNTDSDLVNL